MKRIKFKKSVIDKNRWYKTIATIVGFVFVIIGSGMIFEFKNLLISTLGVFIVLFELSRFFWYKNYVKYNEKTIYIRVNSLWSKKFKFEHISKVHLTSKVLVIAENGMNHDIDLFRIDRNDVDDLAEIIVKKSKADFSSSVMDDQFYKKPQENV